MASKKKPGSLRLFLVVLHVWCLNVVAECCVTDAEDDGMPPPPPLDATSPPRGSQNVSFDEGLHALLSTSAHT